MKRILCRLCNVNDNPTANKPSLLYFVAIYKPDPEIEYTEDSPVKPYDYMSNLVKDWELAARIHEDVQKRCRQVILRSGQGQQCPNNQNSLYKKLLQVKHLKEICLQHLVKKKVVDMCSWIPRELFTFSSLLESSGLGCSKF